MTNEDFQALLDAYQAKQAALEAYREAHHKLVAAHQTWHDIGDKAVQTNSDLNHETPDGTKYALDVIQTLLGLCYVPRKI